MVSHLSNAWRNGRCLQRSRPTTEASNLDVPDLAFRGPSFRPWLLFPWWQSKIKTAVSSAMTMVSLLAATEIADRAIVTSASPAAWMVLQPAFFNFTHHVDETFVLCVSHEIVLLYSECAQQFHSVQLQRWLIPFSGGLHLRLRDRRNNLTIKYNTPAIHVFVRKQARKPKKKKTFPRAIFTIAQIAIQLRWSYLHFMCIPAVRIISFCIMNIAATDVTKSTVFPRNATKQCSSIKNIKWFTSLWHFVEFDFIP